MDFRKDIIEAIGHTPLIQLWRASEATGCNILGKAEFMNPGQSVKDRPARQMILEAEKRGELKPGGLVVEATAGNTGIGLALVADFRIACAETRFSANFTRLGFHPGFGLTTTLPRVVGPQHAALMFYTGRRVPGEEAVRIGLADHFVPQAEVRQAAQALAAEIAQSAPLAVVSTRETMRRGLADQIEASTERELFEQEWLRRTADFKEGVAAMNARRTPDFAGR